MDDLQITAVIRCSDDIRIFDTIQSLESSKCRIVAGIVSDSRASIKQFLNERSIPFVVTPKGNPAQTTIMALNLVETDYVFLIDSDCILLNRAIDRLNNLIITEPWDIIRPNIIFEGNSFSGWLTSIQRFHQYSFAGYVYEPGLLINTKRVKSALGGYIFTKDAPFTPDGELDYRIRTIRHNLKITTDMEKTILHRELDYFINIYSHFRYGMSDANASIKLNLPLFKDFLASIPQKYATSIKKSHGIILFFAVIVCDISYVIGFLCQKIKR
jgi:hypothetical protein